MLPLLARRLRPCGPRMLPIRSPVFPIQVRTVKTSNVDWKPLKAKKTQLKTPNHRFLLALLFLMPVVSFGLGTWQVKRLRWKQDIIAKAENKLTLPPLPLPPVLNANIVDEEFDYRRVTVTGTYRHDQEMLVGPRVNEGTDGYIVVTPLERKDGSKVLINRGWIKREFRDQAKRPMSLPQGEQTVECLLRKRYKKNMFTADSREPGMYHFLDIDDMAAKTGAQSVHIQALPQTVFGGIDYLPEQLIKRGVPLGYPAKVEFRNTHFQYILTWYGLSALTTIMFIRLLRQQRRPVGSDLAQKLKHARSIDR